MVISFVLILIEVFVFVKEKKEKQLISFSVFTKESEEVVTANSFKEESKQEDIFSSNVSPTKKVLENAADSPRRKKRRRKADKLSDRRAKVEEDTVNE